jgi:hypothetical protein
MSDRFVKHKKIQIIRNNMVSVCISRTFHLKLKLRTLQKKLMRKLGYKERRSDFLAYLKRKPEHKKYRDSLLHTQLEFELSASVSIELQKKAADAQNKDVQIKNSFIKLKIIKKSIAVETNSLDLLSTQLDQVTSKKGEAEIKFKLSNNA